MFNQNIMNRFLHPQLFYGDEDDRKHYLEEYQSLTSQLINTMDYGCRKLLEDGEVQKAADAFATLFKVQRILQHTMETRFPDAPKKEKEKITEYNILKYPIDYGFRRSCFPLSFSDQPRSFWEKERPCGNHMVRNNGRYRRNSSRQLNNRGSLRIYPEAAGTKIEADRDRSNHYFRHLRRHRIGTGIFRDDPDAALMA